MSLTITAGPATEPVDLAVAKAHLRVDGTAEDAYIESLIKTSRLQIEAALGLALIAQSWRWTLDDWPRSGIAEPPLHPILSVQSIEVKRADGTPVLVPASAYHLDGQATPPRLVADYDALPAPGVSSGGIAINFSAGFGADASDVPAPIHHALLLLIAHWFECREPDASRNQLPAIPAAVSALLSPYRVVRL